MEARDAVSEVSARSGRSGAAESLVPCRPHWCPPPRSGVLRIERSAAATSAPVDTVSLDDAVERITGWRTAPRRKTHTLLNVNAALLTTKRDDPRLAHAIDHADLVVLDRALSAENWRGRRPAPRALSSGVDLVRRLLEVGGALGLSVYLLGATQQRLDALQRHILETHPGVRIVGARNGFFLASESAAVVRAIREVGADVLLVDMPSPFQELWCEQHRDELDTPVVLEVGGAFEALSGLVPRAPRFLEEARIAWAWRLAMQPWRLWRRYLARSSAPLSLHPGPVADPDVPCTQTRTRSERLSTARRAHCRHVRAAPSA